MPLRRRARPGTVTPARERICPGVALGVAFFFLGGHGAEGPSAAAASSAPKYYFQLREVESSVPVDEGIRQFAGDALRAELASRPEWESSLPSAANREQLVAELARRKLEGFDLTVKIVELQTETKDPRPGARLRRQSVTVKVAILGTTVPGEKMAFSGDGETSYETELAESRRVSETESLVKDAIRDALKQAVDQAISRLGAPRSTPTKAAKNAAAKHKAAKKTPRQL